METSIDLQSHKEIAKKTANTLFMMSKALREQGIESWKTYFHKAVEMRVLAQKIVIDEKNVVQLQDFSYTQSITKKQAA